MMLLASISWFGLLVLVAGGWLVLRLVNGRRGEGRCGGLKLLGLVAIVAGIAVFWMRSDRQVHVEQVRRPEVTVFAGDNHFAEIHTNRDVWAAPVDRGVDRWVFITLGSALVILGALMFGRGGTRPVALKAVTCLGIGAILYAVVTFLGQAPRPSRHSRHDTRVVRVETRDIPRITVHEDRAQRRRSRAKRPSLRPLRPTGDDERTIEELPPRAGEIPVSAELERQASTPEPPPETAEAPTAASEPAKAEQPQPAAAPVDLQEPVEEPKPADEPEPVEPAESDAEPDTAEAPSEPAPQGEASEPAAPANLPDGPPKPDEAPKPEEPEIPSEPPEKSEQPAKSEKRDKQVEPAKQVEPEPPADEASIVTTIGEPRPDWVDALPGLSGGVYSTQVSSGPFASWPECQRELDSQMKSAADHYINEYLGEQAAALVDIPLSYLQNRVKKAEYVEVVHPENLADLGLGPMYQIHARLEFDETARADFRRQWRNAEVVNRLWYTGGAAALVLALLATLYGYLKLDLRTGGAHKGRLQLAATLVALIAAAGVLLVRWAVPF